MQPLRDEDVPLIEGSPAGGPLAALRWVWLRDAVKKDEYIMQDLLELHLHAFSDEPFWLALFPLRHRAMHRGGIGGAGIIRAMMDMRCHLFLQDTLVLLDCSQGRGKGQGPGQGQGGKLIGCATLFDRRAPPVSEADAAWVTWGNWLRLGATLLVRCVRASGIISIALVLFRCVLFFLAHIMRSECVIEASDSNKKSTRYLANFVVSPEYRGKGIGVRMLESIFKSSLIQKDDIIALDTNKDKLIHFYGNLGFRSIKYTKYSLRVPLCEPLDMEVTSMRSTPA
jgi:ribosomal protein S18 acetylase RimI-like enzyme